MRGIASGMTECLFKPLPLDVLLKVFNSAINENASDAASLPSSAVRTIREFSHLSDAAFEDFAGTVRQNNEEDLAGLRSAVHQRDAKAIRHHAH